MGRVSNHAKMEMDQANAVLGAAKQSKCCIMAANMAPLDGVSESKVFDFRRKAAYANLSFAAEKVELVARKISKPISYRWMIDGIRYKRGPKIMVPLEILFETESRSEKIELLHIGHVDYFSVGFRHSNLVGRELAEIANKFSSRTVFCSEFLSIVNKAEQASKRVRIATMQDQSTDDLLKATIYANSLKIPDEHFVAVPNTAYLAERMKDDYIGVADIGEMKDTSDVIALTSDAPEIVRVAYPHPVRVGLAYRKDDSDWGNICEQAWKETKSQINENTILSEDYRQFAILAKQVGINVSPI